jgi:DNA-binding CsgD family transcriptional regulator
VYLSTSQTRALGDVTRLLAGATDGDGLREQLALPMLELLGADTYVSMVWNGAAARFERFRALNVSADDLRAWDEHYRFVDPLTFPMMARRRPTVATQILRQHELARTEFFNDFLMRNRMHWGINVYFYDREQCVGDFRIWRRRERGNFDAGAIEALRLVEPAITAALARLHWETSRAPEPRASEGAEASLQRLAHLSRREAEVAWLVACGGPDKQIARRLGLAYATVRFHLAHAFAKLQVDNRAALAARVHALLDAERRAAAALPAAARAAIVAAAPGAGAQTSTAGCVPEDGVAPDSAACSLASCSGESDERSTRPLKRDSSASTFSGCALRTSTNSAECPGCKVLASERMKSSLMP